MKRIVFILSMVVLVVLLSFCSKPKTDCSYIIEVEYYDHDKDTLVVEDCKDEFKLDVDEGVSVLKGSSFGRGKTEIIATRVLKYRILDKKELTYKPEK